MRRAIEDGKKKKKGEGTWCAVRKRFYEQWSEALNGQRHRLCSWGAWGYCRRKRSLKKKQRDWTCSRTKQSGMKGVGAVGEWKKPVTSRWEEKERRNVGWTWESRTLSRFEWGQCHCYTSSLLFISYVTAIALNSTRASLKCEAKVANVIATILNPSPSWDPNL